MSRRKKSQFRPSSSWCGHKWETRDNEPCIYGVDYIHSKSTTIPNPDFFNSVYPFSLSKNLTERKIIKSSKTWFCNKCGTLTRSISLCKLQCNNSILEQIIDS